MASQTLAWVLAKSKAKRSDLLVLLAIADHANPAGGGAWPTIHHLADKTGLSPSTVSRCIGRLRQLGELSTEHKHGRTVYTINVSAGGR